MFKQEIRDGYQVEVPDNWLKNGYPFELKRPEYAKEIKFGGYVRVNYNQNTGRNDFIQEGYQSVRAIPYDLPVVGYGNNVVDTLRIWDAEAINDFQLDSFDKGDYHKAVEQENLAHHRGGSLPQRRPHGRQGAAPETAVLLYLRQRTDSY